MKPVVLLILLLICTVVYFGIIMFNGPNIVALFFLVTGLVLSSIYHRATYDEDEE